MDFKKYTEFIRAIEIDNVSLGQVQAKRIWSEGLPNNPVFTIHYEAHRVESKTGKLKFKTDFIVKGYDEDQKEFPDVMEMLFSLELQYDISSLDETLFEEREYEELLEIFKKRNINLKINYSLEYKKNNIFKQLNLNFIKYSLSTLIVLIFILMGLNIYKNYKQENDILLIEQELQDIISQIDREYNLDDQDSEIEYIVPDDDDNLEETTTAPKNNYVSSYYKNYEKVFDTLLNINSDTKGWITVNNTRIDYPVVQAKDNEYYLKRDFNKHRNSMGWVFMDYRNDIDILNQNTIIYGHNINGGIMFGTLRYALNKNWSQKDENRIITFNTLNSSMKWKIFSIYRIPNTTDYLYTTFYDHDKYQAFLDLITERSIYDFEEELDTSDKILTLSTCHDRGKDRIVLHAKLIKE